MAEIYCRPVFGRGTGLGNRLFPWARSRVFSLRTGARMLAPAWVTPRVGPLLRRDVPWQHWRRQILLQGLFRAGPDELGRLSGAVVSARAAVVAEHDAETASARMRGGPRIVEFRGDGNRFGDLRGQELYLRTSLCAATRRRWLDLARRYGEPGIALNVRCGKDFPPAAPGELYSGRGVVRTPVSWFIAVLRRLRSEVGLPVSAVVVSDGAEEELKPLLGEPHTELVRPACAISDLLVLASSAILVASGGSSFGAWASYLGGMPTVTIPGQSYSWFGLPVQTGHVVATCDPSIRSAEFFPAAASSLERWMGRAQQDSGGAA